MLSRLAELHVAMEPIGAESEDVVEDVVIVDAVRTAHGKRDGSLA